MKITKEEILHIANLARLSLTDEEANALRADMEGIIDFASELSALDTEGVIPTAHARHMANAFREDEIKESYERDDILKNAPQKQSGGFAVPKVVE